MTPDEVRVHVEHFQREVDAAHGALAASIQREVGDALDAAARRAAREHARLVDASAEDGREPGADADVLLWRRVVAYRAAVVESVLAPLHERLAGLDVGRRLAALWAEARRALVEAAAAVPELVAREEPRGTYAPREGDGALRRGGLLAVRAGRSVAGGGRALRGLGRRLLGAEPLPIPGRVQRVPLRTLLHRHATTRLVAVEDDVLETLRERLARSLSHCERELGVWTDAMVEAEIALDRPTPHAAGGPPPAEEAEANAPGAEDAEGVDPEIDASAADTAADAAADAARELSAAIDSLVVGDVTRPLEEAFACAVEESNAALERDLREVGTFMLPDADLEASEGLVRSVREATEREARWIDWYDQATTRIGLELHLGRVRTQLLESLASFDGDVVTTVVDPVQRMLADACDRIAPVRERVERALRSAQSGGDFAELESTLAAARDDVTGALEAQIVARLAAERPIRSLRERADARVAEIAALLGSLPDGLLVHRPVPPTDPLDTDVKPADIRLRQIAEQAYDAVHLERVRVAPEPLAALMDRVRTEVTQLEGVVRFNMDSAMEELRARAPESAGGLEGARELALNGLDRTVATLDELDRAVAAERAPFRERLLEAHLHGWRQFHDRVRVEDRVQEQILDLGYRVRAELRRRATGLSDTVRRGGRRGMKWVRLGRRRAMRLVRLGQSALEGERVTEEQKRRTIDALSSLEDVLGKLPLVYRRLFSFQPVGDPGLLEGRGSDVEALARHFAQWREGLTDAFVITGYDGNGRTSFLNVVAATVLAGADVRRVRLLERVTEEGALAGKLAEVLGVGDAREWTLQRLAATLMSRPRDTERPLCCIVENIEHLMLRSSTDNGLVAAFLAFMSRVDASVFWIATLAEPAWSYVEKVEATTACLVRRHALAPLGRDALEAVVMNRHRRSGLRLEFQPPASPSPMLRRRLSRAGGEEERQDVLRGDYFEQLARLTGQNLLLALFYWVRSVQVDADSSTVRARALEPVSFAFIDAFTLAQSFTLKAFMDHATLTLAEHDRIFRMSRAESHHMFESLGNLLVIEPAMTTERVSQFQFTTIDDGQRYRIRPLVVHPVLTHLRSKNILV